jgi:hypothetical protein
LSCMGASLVESKEQTVGVTVTLAGDAASVCCLVLG